MCLCVCVCVYVRLRVRVRVRVCVCEFAFEFTVYTHAQVYKELMSEHQKIIPANYVSKVRIQVLFARNVT